MQMIERKRAELRKVIADAKRLDRELTEMSDRLGAIDA